MTNSLLKSLTLLLVVGICISCTPEPIDLNVDNRFGSLPSSPISPIPNPYSSEKVKLGKLLFWDPILSGNKDVACVTCHHPSHGYAEQLEFSIGVGGEGLSASRRKGTIVKRNSQTILNSAFNGITAEGYYNPEMAPMFWDNRNQSLEEQAIEPILSAEEMRGELIPKGVILDTVVQRLKEIPAYVALFEAAFGQHAVTAENLGRAIAAFERTLVANQSRFDQYVAGDPDALSSLEIRGMMNFIETGCANCHSGPMFSDFELHVLTVPENDKLNLLDDGDGSFAFRTPTLRNLDITPPYMHNGVFATLEEVLEFYDEATEESQNPNVSSGQRDEKLRQLQVDDDEVSSIIAFLRSLNDNDFDAEIIKAVPSGLNPGGNIDL